MIVFAKDFDEFKKYMGNALVNHFPESFILYVFIDEEMKQPVIEVKQTLIKSEMKFTLDCDYKTAASVVNDFLTDKQKSDFDYNRKNTPVGLKIRIKEDDTRMDFMNVFKSAFDCEKFNVSKTDAQTMTNKLAKLLMERKAMYFVNGGFNCNDMADAFVAGCSAMYECMMDKVSDSVHCVLNAPADMGNETLTVNEAAEIFKYLIENMQSEKSKDSGNQDKYPYQIFLKDLLWVLIDYDTSRLCWTDKAEGKVLSLRDVVELCYHIFSKNGDNAGIKIDENKIDYNYDLNNLRKEG